jgi:hypothetical protein
MGFAIGYVSVREIICVRVLQFKHVVTEKIPALLGERVGGECSVELIYIF